MNVTDILEEMDRSALDDMTKKVVLDSLSSGAAPLREAVSQNRHQYRAALAWLRGAAGRRKLRRLENERKKARGKRT